MSKTARRILIILVFVVGLGYFTFSAAVYDPFEGSYMDRYEGSPDVAIEYVVPREVDFLVHKRGLAADFENSTFPIPDLWEEIRIKKSWRRFQDTDYAKKLGESLGLEAKIEEIRNAIDQIPMLDPVADVLGRDVAVFGRIKGFGYDHDEVAAVFLGSGSVRFAYAATMNSVLRSLFGMPVEIEVDGDGVVAFTLPDGKKIYTHRHLDLFVVSTGPGLVKEVMQLVDLGVGIEQSLGRSRGYGSTVAQDRPEFAGIKVIESAKGPPVEERLQIHARLSSLFSLTEADDRLLDPMGRVSRWLLARLINPRYFKDLTLDFAIDEAIELKGTLGFDDELANAAKTGFYESRTFELKKVMDKAAAVLPDDTSFLVAARVDMKQFLPQIIDGLQEVDKHAVELINELIASVRKTRPDFRALNSADAMRAFSSFLGPDIVIAIKRDTYFGTPKSAVPLVAIFFEVTERGPSIDELKKASGDPAKTRGYNGFIYPIMAAHGQIKAKSASIANWFNVTHEGADPDKTRIVQEVILAGTSELRNIAFGIVDPDKQEKGPWQMVLVLSPHVESRQVKKPDGTTKAEDFGTAQEFITDIIKLSVYGYMDPPAFFDASQTQQRTVRRLSNSEKYTQGSSFLERFASVAMFLDANGLKEILTDQAQVWADDASAVDWKAEEARISEELMSGEFASWRGKPMTEKVKTDFDAKVASKKEDVERNRVDNVVPRLRSEFEQGLAWVDLFEDAFFAARVDDKEPIIELGARVRTNLK